LPIFNEAESPVLAFHTASLVLPNELSHHSKMNILKYPDIGLGRRITNRVKDIF